MTLLLTLFIPTISLVMLGLTAIATIFSEDYLGPFPSLSFSKYFFLIIFILYFLLIYFTILRLKRVELSQDQILVSNFFKTYAYRFSDIESLKRLNFILFKLWIIKLKYKGKFGRRIPFILNKVQMNYSLEYFGFSNFNEVLNLQMDK